MPHFKIEELLKLPQHEQRSKEWFEQRYTKLTSSDAATVLDINPYSKYEDLVMKKCGYDEKPFVGNIATKHGQMYEDIAIELYCRITGRINYNFGLICYTDVHKNLEHYNPDYDFLAGSPDGIAESVLDKDEEPILLEVKCPYRRKIIDGYIPEYYYPQVQLNLIICNLHIADFIEYCPSTNRLNIVRIYRSYDWFDSKIPRLMQFWNDVLYNRKHGIETYPYYIQKKQKEALKLEKAAKKSKKVTDKVTEAITNKKCIIIEQ